MEKAQAANLRSEDMPDKIYIISDMQFNIIEGNSEKKINFQEIDEKYKKYDYKKPDIVFWNVNGSIDDFPVTVNDNGTVLISGPSPSIIKSIVLSEKFDTISIMRTTLDGERYKNIRNLLI